jgi:molecular chaperone DnaK
MAIGIDLGTTFSVMAYVDATGRPEIIPNAEGERLTPSVVYSDGNVTIVGQPAKDAGIAHPEYMAQMFKPKMATDWVWNVGGRRFTPVDLSSLVLEKLKRDAEEYLKTPISQAVITVPAYFGEAQRRFTKDAANRAGLDVLKLLNEPTAAAITFGTVGTVKDETILVYDLGGGTFDVTICRVSNLQFHVLATYGSTNLGGKNFDERILEFVSNEFKSKYGFDPKEDPEAMGELYSRVVRAKHQLSTLETTSVTVAANSKRLSVAVTRAEFEALSRRYVANSMIPVAEALKMAHLGYKDIDRVLLVGGSTRMPMIARQLSHEFGKAPETIGNPDEVVALGAALEALRLDTKEGDTRALSAYGDFVVNDIVSHSLGIHAIRAGAGQPINKILIPRGSKIPCEKTYQFRTATENVTTIRVIVYQGESEQVQDCLLVGDFMLSGLPMGRAADMPVDVTIICNENGIVEVKAIDGNTGTEAKTTFNLR